ncbi:hypothetical protein BSHJ18_00647 [Bacillus velezensis]|nr:hypothetical protein BSHJ18_00647 [Bacillus velezensis]
MKISRVLLAAVILGSVFSITYFKVIKILNVSGQYFAWFLFVDSRRNESTKQHIKQILLI